jgi:crotonobetainyl-CoA:carnitine CoA-transferase CaiB-like acyl-CoA transferase
MAGILSAVHLAASEDCASKAIDTERTSYDARDVVHNLWESMDLPKHALKSLALEGEGLGLPSSFKVGPLAQSAIALSALTAALFHSTRTGCDVPKVLVSLRHACIEFDSEKLYSIAGSNKPALWGPIGGLHKTSDGHVRIHDGFPNHRDGAKRLLGCSANADRAEVASKVAEWKSVELENTAVEAGLPIVALRSYAEWDALPQSRAVSNTPIKIRKIADGSRYIPTGTSPDKCLRGIRVLEMSRVIAAPVAGKTLAVHGADVLWVTSPNLPDLPVVDRDLGRGKRTIQFDINDSRDKETFHNLAKDADVFIQGFRPGALAAKGLSSSEVAKLNPNGMVIANMSAYGSSGPWSGRRGFDSLVQTCSGMNISEAEHFGDPSVTARPTPCQALDHASGYFLAAGVNVALYKRATEGGSYEVEVSLAAVMKYLRSLGQYEGDSGFQHENVKKQEDVPDEMLETRESGFGTLTAVKHSAKIEGVGVGWEHMPKPLGSDEAKWLHYG